MGITSTTGAESFRSTSNPSRSEAQPSDSHFTINGFRLRCGASDLSASVAIEELKTENGPAGRSFRSMRKLLRRRGRPPRRGTKPPTTWPDSSTGPRSRRCTDHEPQLRLRPQAPRRVHDPGLGDRNYRTPSPRSWCDARPRAAAGKGGMALVVRRLKFKVKSYPALIPISADAVQACAAKQRRSSPRVASTPGYDRRRQEPSGP
jgi:hypothetical protein